MEVLATISFNREWKRVFVSTDKSFHVLTEDGAPVLSVPRVQDRQKDKYIVRLGGLENPERYFAWYGPTRVVVIGGARGVQVHPIPFSRIRHLRS